MLRDYQEEAVEKMVWVQRELAGNSVITLPTGAGKTHVIAGFVEATDEPLLILAPSKELIEQNLEKLKRVAGEEEIGVFSASLNSRDIRKYTLATIGSIYKNPSEFAHYRTVIVDECFVAGTKVDGKNIEDIRPGDYVDSYNHTTNQIEKKKVLAVSKKPIPDNLYFTDAKGVSIISTYNHPIYTSRGYTAAGELRKDDTIYAKNAPKRTTALSVFSLPKKIADKIILYTKKTLGRKGGFLQKVWAEKTGETSYKSEVGKTLIKGTQEINQQNNETKGYSTSIQRGKWERADRSRTNITKRAWRRMAATYNKNWKIMEKWRTISASLQSGHGTSGKENSRRSRWELTQLIKTASPRQKKGQTLTPIRVESVSVQKRGDKARYSQGDKRNFVYNLEVEDNNNYFANGILVHNCHLVNPDKEATRYKKLFAGMGRPSVFGLTATPYRLSSFQEFPGGWSKYNPRNRFHRMQIETVTTTKMITRHKKPFWDRMLFTMNTRELQERGFLSELVYSDLSYLSHRELPTNKSHSEFDLDAFSALLEEKEGEIAKRLTAIASEQGSLLVFCASLAQAKRLSGAISGSHFVSGETPKKERELAITSFREAGGIMFNVGVLTTGFDYPELSALALLRPTRSLNLYNQMLGRLTRRTDSKRYAYVYDFSGTVRSLGRLETIQVVKREGAWDVVSETTPEGFHNKALYRWRQRG